MKEYWRRRLALFLILLIAIGYLVLSVYTASTLSPTQDEPLHLAAGHSYWQESDYRLQPENGLLSQRWIGLGNAFRTDIEPIATENGTWEQGLQWFVAYDYLRENGEGALLAGRLAIVFAGLLLLLGVFVVSRSLWGRGGGILSLALAAFSPTLLAGSSLATSDLFLALTFFLGAVSLARLVFKPSFLSILLAGLACGAAALSKYTAIILAPYALILLVVYFFIERKESGNSRRVVGSVLGLIAAGLVAYTVLWSGYGFRYSTFSPEAESGAYNQPLEDIQTDSVPSYVLAKLREYRIFPEPFLYGAEQAYTFSRSRAAFFLGETGSGGWRLYFPIAFLAKSGPIVLALLILSLFLALSGRIRPTLLKTDSWQRFLLISILSAGTLFFAFCISSRLNIGHRHMLPVYPFLFVWIGGVWPTISGNNGRAAVAGLAFLHALLAVWTAPAYLSHINFFFGGSGSGHRLFSDSSYDWGQEMYVLSQWLEEHPEGGPPMLGVFAPMEPDYYGIKGDVIYQFGAGFPMHASVKPLRPGRLAVTATILSGPYFLTSSVGWSDVDERNYWVSRTKVEEVIEAAGDDPSRWMSYFEAHPDIPWKTIFSAYSRLRIKRFLAVIAEKDPVARPSDTIFVWNVDETDLSRGGFDSELMVPAAVHLPKLLRDWSERNGD